MMMRMLRLPSTSLPLLVAATAVSSVVVFSPASSLAALRSTPPPSAQAGVPPPLLSPELFIVDHRRLRRERGDDHRHHRESDVGHHHHATEHTSPRDHLHVVHHSEEGTRPHGRAIPELRAGDGILGLSNLEHPARDITAAVDLVGQRRRRDHSSSSSSSQSHSEIGSMGKRNNSDDDTHALLIPFIFLLILFGVGLVCYGLTNLIPWAVRGLGRLVPCSCRCCPFKSERRRTRRTPVDARRATIPRHHNQHSHPSVEDRIAYLYGGGSPRPGTTADLDHQPVQTTAVVGGGPGGTGATTSATMLQPAVLAWMEMEVEEWRRRRHHIEAMMMMGAAGAGPVAASALSSPSPSSSSHGRGTSVAGGGLACGYTGEERRKLLEIVLECRRYEPSKSDRNDVGYDDASDHRHLQPPQQRPKVKAIDIGSLPAPPRGVAATDENDIHDDDTSRECLSPPAPPPLQHPDGELIKRDGRDEGSGADQEVQASTIGMRNGNGGLHTPLPCNDDFVDDVADYVGGAIDECSVGSGSNCHAGERVEVRGCEASTHAEGMDEEGVPSPNPRCAVDSCQRTTACRRRHNQRRGSRHEPPNELSGDRTCAICLDEFKEGEMLNMSKRCSHVFHRDCLLLWLERNDACPCCRTVLVTVDDLEKAAVGVLPPPMAGEGYGGAVGVGRSAVPSDGDSYHPDRTGDHHLGATLPWADEGGVHRQDRHLGGVTMTQRRRPDVGDPFGLGLVTAPAVPALMMDGGDYLGQEEWIEFIEDAYPSDGPDVLNFDRSDR